MERPVISFHLRYSLSRGQRLATELPPWVPAIAGSLGFGIGAIVLAADVSPWFLFLLLLPAVFYRGLVRLALDVIVRPRQAVEVRATGPDLEVTADGRRHVLPLAGIFQVYRSGPDWTVLHLDRTVLTIPGDAIAPEQVEYLKSFALAAAADRRSARADR
jgi:hypothetical protein